MMPSHRLDFVHQFVAAPSVTDTDTLLLLHGTGGDENDLLPLGKMLNPNANLLSPRGRMLENGMPRFFRRLAEGVLDIPDLIVQAQALAEFVSEAAAVYGFDPARVVAAGFSNGANIAGALLLLHPMVPLVPETLPDLAGTPVFVGAGRQDPLVAAAETERLAALLRSAGADVTLNWQPGGHALTREEVAAAKSWLEVQR